MLVAAMAGSALDKNSIDLNVFAPSRDTGEVLTGGYVNMIDKISQSVFEFLICFRVGGHGKTSIPLALQKVPVVSSYDLSRAANLFRGYYERK